MFWSIVYYQSGIKMNHDPINEPSGLPTGCNKCGRGFFHCKCDHDLDYTELETKHARLLTLAEEMREALEFVTMPITIDKPTIEGLLQTFEIDRHRTKKAIAKFDEAIKAIAAKVE